MIVEHEGEGDGDISYSWSPWNSPQEPEKEKRLSEQEIGGRIKTMETTALLKSARILKRILEI